MGIFDRRPKVEKLVEKRDVKGLVKVLLGKDVWLGEDETVREEAAVALDKIGWDPSDDTEKAYYLAAKRKWDELARIGARIGKPAVKPLILYLGSEEVDVRVNTIRTLGEIGNAETINDLVSCPYNVASHELNEDNWRLYGSLVPVIAKALASIGKSDVKPLIEVLKDVQYSTLAGIPILWALCEIGDRKAIEAIVDWIFSVGQLLPMYVTTPISIIKISENEFRPISPSNLIRMFVSQETLQKLLGKYTDLILDIFTWVHTIESGQWDIISKCNKAIQSLCMIKTPISSNILHKVSKIDSVCVDWIGYDKSYIDFEPFTQMAKDELKHRDNPRYDPAVYLNQDAWRI